MRVRDRPPLCPFAFVLGGSRLASPPLGSKEKEKKKGVAMAGDKGGGCQVIFRDPGVQDVTKAWGNLNL